MTWPAFSLGVWGYPERMDPRVPPGQFVTERFPILTYGETPKVAKEAWRSGGHGTRGNALVLTYEDLLARPQVELTRDFHCVTRWSRLDVTWKGVRTRDLLEEARPRPEAVAALVESYGGYTTNLLLEDLLREDVLLAHTLFGKPLPGKGGPVRLLVPHLYAWKSAKWVRRIVLLDHLELGFWERLGYHWRGTPGRRSASRRGRSPPTGSGLRRATNLGVKMLGRGEGMRLEEARIAVDEALSAYRRCVEAEVEEYGPEYERVTFMEYEAPAPDPCAEAFLRLVEAVRAYEAAGEAGRTWTWAGSGNGSTRPWTRGRPRGFLPRSSRLPENRARRGGLGPRGRRSPPPPGGGRRSRGRARCRAPGPS